MVTIRLSRGGAKKQPFYHIVATDSRSRRDGRYIERLGFYNPVARSSAEPVRIDIDRVDYWVSHGAQMSERVSDIVKSYRKYGTEDPNANKRQDKKAARKAAARAAKAVPAAEEETEEAVEAAADASDDSAADAASESATEASAEAAAEEAPAEAEEKPAEEAPAEEAPADESADKE